MSVILFVIQDIFAYHIVVQTQQKW